MSDTQKKCSSALVNFTNAMQGLISSGQIESEEKENIEQIISQDPTTFIKGLSNNFTPAILPIIEQTFSKITGLQPVNNNNTGAIFGKNTTVAPSVQDSASQSTNKTTTNTQTISTNQTSSSSPKGKKMDIPNGNTSYKSYTNYKAVANHTTRCSCLWFKIAIRKICGTTYNTKTDSTTGVRYVTFEGDDTKYYCAAMGTYYGEVGDTFQVTTDKGNSYNVIMCDAKGSDAQGKHNWGTWYHSSGGNKCLTEFYIESNYMPDSMKVYSGGKYIGTTGTYDSVKQFSGNITSISKLS